MDSLNFNSVETLPDLSARAVFKVSSSSVFKEDVDIMPTAVDERLLYVPWGGDNQMPFNIINFIEKDDMGIGEAIRNMKILILGF